MLYVITIFAIKSNGALVLCAQIEVLLAKNRVPKFWAKIFLKLQYWPLGSIEYHFQTRLVSIVCKAKNTEKLH
jgi:hypothetical protein